MRKRRTVVYYLFYIIMVLTLAILVVESNKRFDGVPIEEELSEDAISFDAGWTLEDGSDIDITNLSNNNRIKVGTQFSVYNRLPDELSDGVSLCFRTKNILYKVYVGDELRYSSESADETVYNKSIGNRHNFIFLSSGDAGKEVKIKITTVYENARNGLFNMSIANSGGVILKYIKSKLFPVATSLMLLFVGVFLLIADIPLNAVGKKNHELLFLGIMSMAISVWSFIETGVLQLFFPDSVTIQSISYCMLMLITIPLVMYFDKAFGFCFRHAKGCLCTLSFISFVATFALRGLKVADFHELLILTHVVLFSATVAVIISVIKGFRKSKDGSQLIFRVLKNIGFCSMTVAACIDAVRYYVNPSADAALFSRVGLVIFMVCIGICSMEKTINAVRQGTKAEFVSELAYKDGLTGVGNRTLFTERLAELEENKNYMNEVIIVMFDVNDLKYINDKMGHNIGDELIVAGANVIRNSFERVGGTCYRIGGDEFVVIITGDIPTAQYKEGMRYFEAAITEHNANPDKKFRLSIACGHATYNESSRDKTLSDIFHTADAFMYKNKKEMKAKLIEADEYYTGKLYAGRQ